jgi:hypothetical protein
MVKKKIEKAFGNVKDKDKLDEITSCALWLFVRNRKRSELPRGLATIIINPLCDFFPDWREEGSPDNKIIREFIKEIQDLLLMQPVDSLNVPLRLKRKHGPDLIIPLL